MANWYIRPNSEITVSGDGTLPTEAAYAGGPGAFRGSLKSTMWPAGMMAALAPGDTIYIIGTWDTAVSYQRQIEIVSAPIAGSEGSPITIRGDLAGYNPCKIVSVAYKIASGSSWTDMGDGTYRYALASLNASYLNMLEGTEADLYRVYTSAECQATDATFYHDGSTYLYVNPVSGVPSDHDYFYGGVPWLILNDDHHDLDFRGIAARGGITSVDSGPNCRFGFYDLDIQFATGAGSTSIGGIHLNDTSAISHVTIQNCKIWNCKAGIYLTTDAVDIPPSYIDILDNDIRYMGKSPAYETPGDVHGIALQGGHNIRIMGNWVEDCGHQIAAYMSYTGIDYYDNEIAYNISANAPATWGDGMVGVGVLTSTNNDSDTENNSGNYYHHNLIYNCPVGFRPGCHDPSDPEHIHNNVIYGCDTGVKLFRNSTVTYNCQVELLNNIFANNTVHIDYASGDKTYYKLDSRFNIFAEDGAAKFHHVMHSPYYYNFAGWQGIVEDGTGSTLIPDTSGSSVADPLFVSSSSAVAAGFKVTSASPCIDAGIDVSGMATLDYFGNTTPQGLGRDIGFFETSSTAVTVATPTASPPGGIYTSAQSVSLSTTTSGASIYYTLDGSDPTSGDSLYSSALDISASATVKAFALKSGFTDSGVMTEAYTITGTVATPVASPVGATFNNDQSVTLSCSTSGSSIYYTTNGADPTSASTLFTSAIPITQTLTLKAIGLLATWADSAIMSETYTLQVATPTANPPAGSYTSAQSVALSCGTSAAAIYYTSDGAAPTSASTLYASAISVTSSATIKAIGIKAGYTDSAILTAAYTITGTSGGNIFALWKPILFR